MVGVVTCGLIRASITRIACPQLPLMPIVMSDTAKNFHPDGERVRA
jgi:hypothetical protein